MPMTLLLVAAFAVLVVLLYVADRAIKAHVQWRRRHQMEERLGVAQAKAKARVEQQRRAAQAREALTSVMPGIHTHKPRHVTEPSLSSDDEPGDRRVA
jgi:hypothetical protein